MRKTIICLFASGFLVPCFAANAATPLSTEQQAVYESLAKMSEQDRQEIIRRLAEKGKSPPAHASAAPKAKEAIASAAATPPKQSDGSVDIAVLSKSNRNSVYHNCSGFIPLLRLDWKDIDFASCPQTVDKAAGAQISFSDDRVSKNKNWSTHGTLALVYNVAVSDYSLSTGGYVTVNKSTNSSLAQASNNSDTLAYGGMLEIGTANDTLPYFANYFRLRGGGVEDHIKNTTAANVTFEWLPVYEDKSFVHLHSPFNPIPGVPLIVRFDPELLVQYASVTGRKQILAFNNMQDALRIGPQFALNFYPGTDDFWSRFHGSISYHWAYETYSAQRLDNFQTNLTFNVDKDGYIGLTGSYQRGQDEDTGTFKNIYKLSLSGKI